MARILFVEDDPDIQMAVHHLLEENGHNVTVVGNGMEAMEALNRMTLPTLVVLDLILPVMDGWRVLEALRHDVRFARIPVVVTSGSDENIDGTTAIVRKPYGAKELLQAVESLSSVVLGHA